MCVPTKISVTIGLAWDDGPSYGNAQSKDMTAEHNKLHEEDLRHTYPPNVIRATPVISLPCVSPPWSMLPKATAEALSLSVAHAVSPQLTSNTLVTSLPCESSP